MPVGVPVDRLLVEVMKGSVVVVSRVGAAVGFVQDFRKRQNNKLITRFALCVLSADKFCRLVAWEGKRSGHFSVFVNLSTGHPCVANPGTKYRLGCL